MHTEDVTIGKARLYNYNSKSMSTSSHRSSMTLDQPHNSIFQWSERPLRNDDLTESLKSHYKCLAECVWVDINRQCCI